MAMAQAPDGRAPSFSEEARRRLGAASTDERFEAERQRLLDEARRHLEAGQAEAALDTLDRAALMRHAADCELLIVRALMAAGRYRHALAAGAHAAGAHREQTAGMALYAWLLHVGGQQVVSLRLLDDALDRVPADPLLAYTRGQLARDWPEAGEPLRQSAAGAAPPSLASDASDAPPPGVRVAGTATLLADGNEALSVRGLVADGEPAWVRNGLGQTSRVEARRTMEDAELDLLSLRSSLPPPTWQVALREPFAGSPGCLVEYVPDTRGRAAWPLLRHGFFAGTPASLPSRPLGFDVPKGVRGGPVFDASGRFVGVALPGEPDRLVGLVRLRAVLGSRMSVVAADANAPRVGPEVAYEASLRGTLQLLAAPRVAPSGT